MKQRLFRVSLRNKKTGNRSRVYVWAGNVDEATHSLTGTLIGPNNEYIWEGSGPEYDERGNLIEREAEEPRTSPKSMSMEQQAEEILNGMKEESLRGIEQGTANAAAAWEFSHLGSLDFARQMGLITEERRQQLYEEFRREADRIKERPPKAADLLRMLEKYEELVRLANKADEAWDKDPESADLEKAFDEAYAKQTEFERKLIAGLMKFAGGKAREIEIKELVWKRRTELKRLLERAEG